MILNPDYDFKFKDLYWIIPQMAYMSPSWFWFIELVLSCIVNYYIWIIL